MCVPCPCASVCTCVSRVHVRPCTCVSVCTCVRVRTSVYTCVSRVHGRPCARASVCVRPCPCSRLVRGGRPSYTRRRIVGSRRLTPGNPTQEKGRSLRRLIFNVDCDHGFIVNLFYSCNNCRPLRVEPPSSSPLRTRFSLLPTSPVIFMFQVTKSPRKVP